MAAQENICSIRWIICAVLLLSAPAFAQQDAPSPPASAAQGAPPPAAHDKPQAAEKAVAPGDASAEVNPAVKPRAAQVVVPSGTRLPLVLHNSVTTRSNRPGDPIYLETLFPVLVDSKVVIPAGTYVSGEITEAKRPGRVKGRGELMVKLNTLIFPNGYAASFTAVPTGAAGTGDNDSVEKEGKLKGDTNKSGDAGTIVRGTATGAGIGAIAARSAKGAGIGAGIGAAVGLATVLLTRGPELELPRGTTLDIMLDRPLYLDASRVQFDGPGQASTLPGPPNRKPVRSTTFP
jgi:type IV secretion system protein VirB10